MGTFRCPLLKSLILLVLFWNQALAGTCKEGCPTGTQTSKYKFAPGQVYTYNLDSQVSIYLTGYKQQTQVKITGQAQVFATGNCQYYLTLPKLQITSPGESKVAVTKDITKPVKFILSNDELSSEICTDGSDSPFSVNIKRAIISMIQSVEGKTHETDVFGVCPTSTVTNNVGDDNMMVTKTRDLNACAYRELLSDGFIKGIFNPASGIKSTPILNGDYTMEQKIKSGILDSVTLTEQYVYLPFSTQNTGARAKVITKLTFVKNEAKEAPKQQKPSEKTLLFENDKVTGTTSPENSRAVLRKTVESYDSISKGVGKESATHFAELVKALRNAKKDDLIRLYDDIKKGALKLDKDLTRKVYLDALFRAGSANSISAISELLKKELSETEQRLAYLSFNLVQTVSKDSLVSAAKTLGPQSIREAYMGVGSLVKKYCADKTCSPNDVKDVYTKYANNLGACKPTTRVQEDKIVAVLKAIRNAGILMDPVTQKIQLCLTDAASARIRVAAIQAIGATTCAKNLQTKLIELMKNRVEDSEIRIESYLSLIKCPSTGVANEIKTLLEDEPVYQVGSFITSHLSNIRASADPHRETLRNIFGYIRVPMKFPNDIRKYSFNREYSYAIDSLGVGASVDSNVIYSHKGYLPRSGSLNLTGELFGNVFNVMEMNVRQENLENIFEHYFGPKGELRSNSFQDLFNTALESYNALAEGAKKRFRRGMPVEEVNQFTNGISYQNEVFSDIEMDLSVKLFGTEMYFLSMADDVPKTPKDFIGILLSGLDKNIKDVKNFNKIYENHVLFMDTELIYPSGIGLPLKLGAQGAAAGRVEVGTKIDVKTFKTAPQIYFKIIPSFNIDVSGTLLVDISTVQAGLKLQGRLHSSTGTDVDFKVTDDKKKFDLKFGFPFKNQEVISFKTNTLIIVNDIEKGNVEIPIVNDGQPKMQFSDCFDQFVPLIGINVCPTSELNIGGGTPTSLAFPFAGPNEVSLKLEVEREFTLKGVYDDSKPKHKILTYTFDTPGSTESRRTQLQFETGYDQDYFARISLDNPRKKASIEAGLKNNDKEFAIYGEAKQDQFDYLAKFGFDVKGNEARSEYTPTIVLKAPNEDTNSVAGYKVEGKIIVEKKDKSAKYTFNNIKLITPTNQNYIVNGFISKDDSNVKYDMTYMQESDKKKANLKGGFDYKENEKFLMDIAFVNDFHETINGQIKYEFNRKVGSLIKNDFLLVYGKDLQSTKNRLALSHNAAYTKDEKDGIKTLLTEFKIDAPFAPLMMSGKYEHKPNYANMKFDFENAPPHKLNLYTINKYNTKTKGDFDIEAGAVFNKNDAKVTMLRVVGDNLSDHKYTISSSCGFNFKLDGKFSNTMNVDNLNADFTAVTVMPQKKDTPYTLKFFLMSSKTDFKSNANLMEGSKALMTYTFDGKRGDNKEGKFNMEVTDILSGQGEFKSVKGKGTLSSLVAFKKIDRKVKVESDFNIAEPTYDVNTKFFYDFEKDNNKKIEFTTKSSVSRDNIDSKNILLILTEKYTFNINGKSIGTNSNGNINGGFELGVPTGRKVAGTFDRHREFSDDKGNGKVKFEVYDQLPNGNKRSLTLDTNVKSVDFKQNFFEMTHKLSYIGFDKKEVTWTTNVQRTPGDGFKHTVVGLKIDGSLMPQPITMNFASDEYSEWKAEYKTNGKYGTQFDYDLYNKYDINDDSTKPSLNDFKLIVNVPETKLKTLKIETSSSYKEPEQDDGIYDYTYRGSIGFSDKTAAIDTSYKGNKDKGDVKVVMNLPDNDPINMKINYQQQEESHDSKKAQVDFEMNYGKGKKVHFKSDSHVSSNDIMWKMNLDSPLENAKSIGLDFDWKFTGGNKYATIIKLDVDKRAYTYNGIMVLSEISPSMSIELIYPEKTIKFYMGVQKLDDMKYATQIKMENVLNYNLDMNLEAFFKSVENFYVKMNADGTNIKKLVIEINSKAGGKGVEFKGMKDGKNLLSGSADFQVKDDKGKVVIEGNGNVKYYEENQVTTFKFIRNKFDATKDGETGVSFVFDGRIGSKNIISELKLTDKNVAFKHTVCEAKKQCVNIDFRSTLQKSDINDFKHELLISVDLRELGYTHEFGLKADTSKLGLVIDHTVDMHLQSQDKNKYQYSLYAHKDSAGITLTLPARTVSLESTYNYPVDQIFGKYEATVAFYADKQNNPSGKSSISFIGGLDRSGKNVVKAKGELRLEHPSIKALSISGFTNLDADNQRAKAKITLDLFQQEAKKIIAQADYENADKTGKGFNVTTDIKINSKGLQLDLGFDGHAALNYETRVFSFGSNAICPTKDFTFGTYMYASEKVFELHSRIFNEEVIKVAANYDMNKRSASYNSILKNLGTTPIVMNGQVDGLTTASFTVTKDKLIDVKGQFDLGKEASVNVIGDGKQLFNGKIALDDGHFMATNFKVQEDDIKNFLEKLQTVIKSENESARKAYADKYEALKKAVTGQFDAFTQSFPDFSKLQQDYKNQWEKFQAEMQADPTIKVMADMFVEALNAITKVYNEVTKIWLEFYGKISKVISDICNDLRDVFNTKVMPMLKDLYTQIESLVFSLYEESVSLIAGVFERVAKALKGFEEDFNKISAAMAELFKSVGLFFKEYVEQLQKELKDLYQLLIQQLEAFPGWEVVKTKFEELVGHYAIGEQVAALLKEFLELVKEHLPTPESREFIKKLSDYLNAKLMGKEVNDMQSLKELFESAAQSVRSLFKMISDLRKDKDVATWFNTLPISFEAFKRVSYIWNVKFSPLNCLREGGCFSIRDILAYRPHAFDFVELFPPFKLHAHIGDGEHYFTFDGVHYTFPGSCNYVLAHDAKDKNFKLVANLKNGKMESITLYDKTDNVEITKDGIVKLNNAQTDLPLHQNDIHVWRRYYSISMLTTYGLHVMCSTDLRVCHITASGFYHGRLRGLLGNGNHEPFDDFTTPKGAVEKKDVVFANTYKMADTCVDIKEMSHQHGNDEMCSQLFGSGSPLRLCYFMINNKNYKEACNHAVTMSKDKKDAACNIALLYASTCKLEHIPVSLPDTCAKCKVDGKELELGDDFNVQLPKNQVDAVIVVDTATNSVSDLVNGVLENLRKEFAARQLTDVRIVIIGFNNNEKYTMLFTSNGKLDYNGNFPAPKFNGPQFEKPVKTGDAKIDEFAMKLYDLTLKLRMDFGLSTGAMAVKEALMYPFRPQASKMVLIVTSTSFSEASPGKLLSAGLMHGAADVQGIFVYTMLPLDDLTVGGGKDAKKIVGIGEKNIYMLADGRKQPEGSTESRDKVEYKNDDAIELALQNNGIIFALENFEALEAKQKKQFTLTMSAAMADQISRTQQKLECKCFLKYSMFPEQICHVVDTTVAPPPSIKSRG